MRGNEAVVPRNCRTAAKLVQIGTPITNLVSRVLEISVYINHPCITTLKGNKTISCAQRFRQNFAQQDMRVTQLCRHYEI